MDTMISTTECSEALNLGHGPYMGGGGVSDEDAYHTARASVTPDVWVRLKAGPSIVKGCVRSAVDKPLRIGLLEHALVEAPAQAVLFRSARAKVQRDVLEGPILDAIGRSVSISPEARVWIEDGDVGEIGLVP